MLAIIIIISVALIGAVVMLLLSGVAVFNRLLHLQDDVSAAWADLVAALKSRQSAVRDCLNAGAYVFQAEVETLKTALAGLKYADEGACPAELANAESVIDESIVRLSALYAESHASNEKGDITVIVTRLKEIEVAVSKASGYYNQRVSEFNAMVDSFPSNIIAARFGFKKKEFFLIQSSMPKEY